MPGTDKLKPFLIGKFKNPQCLKGVKGLPVDYEANGRAWMTSDLFETWARKADKQMRLARRHILLFIDNCPAHPELNGLTNIKLMFLPPNTTSHLQPCDQGIIKAFKVYYRKFIVDSALSSFENSTEAQINIKIYRTSAAWQMVSVKCIANCFKKAGFEHSSQVNDVHAEDPEEDISLSKLRLLLRENFPETSADAYVDIDNEVSVSGTFTDDDIVSEIQLQSQCDNHEDDDYDETVESCDTLTVGVSSAMDALKTLRRFFECESDIDQSTFSNLASIEKLLQDKIKNKRRQSKITAFFK